MWQISGKLTNNSDRDLSYVQIQYVLYDKDGVQIGTALDNTNNLKAGGTWKYNASSLDVDNLDEVDSYEIAEVSGF